MPQSDATTAALRAVEIEAEAILKATKVDGVYDADPMKVKDAKKYDTLTYLDIVRDGLKVMDTTAATMCMDNNLPIIVYNLYEKGKLKKVISGEKSGTLVST